MEDKRSLTEAEIRTRYILPAITSKEWDLEILEKKKLLLTAEL